MNDIMVFETNSDVDTFNGGAGFDSIFLSGTNITVTQVDANDWNIVMSGKIGNMHLDQAATDAFTNNNTINFNQTVSGSLSLDDGSHIDFSGLEGLNFLMPT